MQWRITKMCRNTRQQIMPQVQSTMAKLHSKHQLSVISFPVPTNYLFTLILPDGGGGCTLSSSSKWIRNFIEFLNYLYPSTIFELLLCRCGEERSWQHSENHCKLVLYSRIRWLLAVALSSIEVKTFPAINHASQVLLYFNVLLTCHWHPSEIEPSWGGKYCVVRSFTAVQTDFLSSLSSCSILCNWMGVYKESEKLWWKA